MIVPLIFDISGGELVVILLFSLLFFGSKGIPEVARTLGRTMRQLRDATAEVQREIQKGTNEVKHGFEEQRKAFRIEPPENAMPQRQGPVQPAAPDPAVLPEADKPVAEEPSIG